MENSRAQAIAARAIKPMMEVRDLHFAYGDNKILKGVQLMIPQGKITTIMGGNGCGKSTLFGLMTKNLIPNKGKIFLRGKNIQSLSIKEYAKKVSIVHQYNSAAEDTTVEDLIAMGRTPYLAHGNIMTEEDDRIVDWAIEVTNLGEYREREVASLSGGQRQRVWIAMALAQNTKVLFLDEPTTYLDIRYQVEILELIRSLNRNYGITIVMVLHDINQAIAYSDQVIGLKNGKVIISGDPTEVITKESIYKLYTIHLEVTEIDGRKQVLLSEQDGLMTMLPSQPVDMEEIEEETEMEISKKKPKKARSRIAKAVWGGIGCLMLALGAIGVALPILPFVPFFLAALFCFAKSSDRLYNWFINTDLYHRHLESFTDHRAMTLKTKFSIVGTVTIVMGIGFVFMGKVPIGRIILAIVWAVHVIAFFFIIKTEKPEHCEVEKDD